MDADALSLSPWSSWQWYRGSREQQALFWICVALIVQFVPLAFVLLAGLNVPYGRYNQPSEKASKSALMRTISACSLNAKFAWVLQEIPNLVASAVCWMAGSPECKASPGNRMLLLCFVTHYVNRTLIYPLRMRGSKPTPLLLMLCAVAFCALNGYVQCRSLTRLIIIPSSLTTPLGILVWGAGLYANTEADGILRSLRKPGETGYKIPHGGLFRYVSGANFLGEILEWIGFAIAMRGALPGLAFAVCTACNIGPRAVAHHRWYLDKFKDSYPKDRRALIPFVF